MTPKWMAKALVAVAATLLLGPGALRAEGALAADPDEPNAATVISLQPGVQIEEDGQWQTLEEGQPLDAGDHLRSDASGTLQLLLADGSSLAMGPNSEITLRSLGQGGEGSVTLLDLARGLVNAMVEHLRPGATFKIQTSNAVAAVKGTDFELSADAAAGSQVTVQEGTVQMGNAKGDQVRLVTPGRACVWFKGRFKGPFKLGRAQAEAFRARWARAHDLHARRFDLLRDVRARHAGDRARFIQGLRRRRQGRRAWLKAHPAADGADGQDRRPAGRHRRLARRKARPDVQQP